MKVITGFFPSTGVVHIHHAAQSGLFAEQDLDVELIPVTSAHHQMSLWDGGGLTIMHTSPDHLFGDRARHPVAVQAEAFGELCLYARPDLAPSAETRYGVDHPSSGFALVLRRMLEERGLPWVDDRLVPVGGTRQRWAALQAGDVDATLLHTPFRQQAEQRGFVRLGGHLDVLPGLATAVVVAAREDAESAAVRGYVRALGRARAELARSGTELVTQVLVRAGFDERLVALVAADTVAETGGDPGGDLSAGVTEAAELRRRYGVLPPGLAVADVVASTNLMPT